jgi:hypothetical protein
MHIHGNQSLMGGFFNMASENPGLMDIKSYSHGYHPHTRDEHPAVIRELDLRDYNPAAGQTEIG